MLCKFLMVFNWLLWQSGFWSDLKVVIENVYKKINVFIFDCVFDLGLGGLIVVIVIFIDNDCLLVVNVGDFRVVIFQLGIV